MRINFVVLKIRIEALCGPAETGSTLCSNKPRSIPLCPVNRGHGGPFSKPRPITLSPSEKRPGKADGGPPYGPVPSFPPIDADLPQLDTGMH